MNYNEICDKITIELAGQHLEALYEENPDIKMQTHTQAERLEQLQASLSPEQSKLLEEYVGSENALGLAKCQHIYLAGALDAVRLLKRLGVFG